MPNRTNIQTHRRSGKAQNPTPGSAMQRYHKARERSWLIVWLLKG
jgi:hypothetical protein